MAETEEAKDAPEVPGIPTASETVARIVKEVRADGEQYRKEHPEAVRKVAGLIAGVHRGSEIYVENRHREFSIEEVTRCLHGLGYTVKPAHPMVNNPYGPFRVLWWPDDNMNPYLG
jgi:hypothetical protein